MIIMNFDYDDSNVNKKKKKKNSTHHLVSSQFILFIFILFRSLVVAFLLFKIIINYCL
jgi:flagellar biosynthesis/type III secretory pathway M-ring protein FliF/YscJ